ncbi:MAG: protein kinase [Gemmatimonadetes bacterium]|nr:protein kinase [Gemmatimonadota bacterium]
MDDTAIQEMARRLQAAFAGRLQVAELLGVGGFAAVFRARDPLLARDVAIKVLDPSLAQGRAADRLLDEARLIAATEHPHIVPLYEVDRQGDLVSLVMRYFPHGSLAGRLEREGTLPPAMVARLGTEVADALATAHARGVIHLDVKPDNILLDAEGHAAVTDFGIARLAGEHEGAGPGIVSGTPHYMSPEQVAGDRVDGRADVYALGVVLYEMATGHRPVTGASAPEVMANQVRTAPAPLAQVAPELPAALAAIITRALAKDPAARWQSAADMAEALRRAGAADQLLAPREVRLRTRRRWYRRTATLVGGLLVGVIGAVWLVVSIWRAMYAGTAPAIDAMAPRIPATIIDSAIGLGALTPADTVQYVFAPAGMGVPGAFIVTTREMVALPGGRVRRYPISGNADIDLRLHNRSGYLIISDTALGVKDTVYRTMSGRELRILIGALGRTLRADTAR